MISFISSNHSDCINIINDDANYTIAAQIHSQKQSRSIRKIISNFQDDDTLLIGSDSRILHAQLLLPVSPFTRISITIIALHMLILDQRKDY